MKITVEPSTGGTFTAQDDAEQIDQVINMFKGLLVQAGYNPQNVDECFYVEDRWFSEINDPPVSKTFSEKKKQIDSYLNNLYHDDDHVFEK